MSELKACPACHTNNQEIFPNGYVSCECGFFAKSVEVWNTRTDTDLLRRVKEAVKMMKSRKNVPAVEDIDIGENNGLRLAQKYLLECIPELEEK